MENSSSPRQEMCAAPLKLRMCLSHLWGAPTYKVYLFARRQMNISAIRLLLIPQLFAMILVILPPPPPMRFC